MSGTTDPEVSAVALSEAFFKEIVRPALQSLIPQVLEQGAFGRFGYGSECLGLDDQLSRDHHWGPQVDLLLPESVLADLGPDPFRPVAARFPSEFRGFSVKAGQGTGVGLAPVSIESFLARTIGRTSPPESSHDWLDIAEEDIIHITNGKVFCDELGEFSRIRGVFANYYPDDVWKRRIAHWCRYASGMGLYAMDRALARKNWPYVFTTFARTMKLTLELVHMLNRTYFSYDKWLYPLFCKLPRVAPEMRPLIDEAVEPETSWSRRIELFECAHDLVDQSLVQQSIIQPHPPFARSETSGYRLLEHAYGELCRELPADLLAHVPLCDQKYFESFHVGFVAELPMADWNEALNLSRSDT
ncbi:MAG: DUF4037 domain-containing protein [Pirellulales bacterium]|nr:DUF4037 domain-containing protein [Pirellulales bacterium]